MARLYPTIALVFAATITLVPAQAQFGSIFGPPRPPADIPSDEAPPPNFPTSRDRGRNFDPDQQPQRRVQPPMNLPPSQRPGAAIQSEPLAPPGSAVQPAAPLRNAPPPQQATPSQPSRTAPTQREPAGAASRQPAQAEPPSDELALAPPEHRLENPTAVFSGLDKITGRTITFDVAIDETVQFGALQVTPRACYSRPPTETPRIDAFVAVDEVTLQGEVRRIFTGWMFATSPGLHAVEHPIYDVWLADCKGAAQPTVAEAPAETKPEQRPKPPAQPPTQPRRRAQPQPFLSPFR